MTCEELRDEYGTYALGIAEDPERAEIGEHLARNCSDCVLGVRKAMTMVTAMSRTWIRRLSLRRTCGGA